MKLFFFYAYRQAKRTGQFDTPGQTAQAGEVAEELAEESVLPSGQFRSEQQVASGSSKNGEHVGTTCARCRELHPPSPTCWSHFEASMKSTAKIEACLKQQ